MNFKELFVNKSKTLMVNIDLAMALGDLNEAIVLNQLNYWLEINKKADKHFIDDKYWVYNSYSDWRANDFPYWSEKTIQRVFTRLENKGVVISANYNRASFDKTKWYTINEGKLQELIDKHFDKDNLSLSEDNMTDDKDNLTRREGQSDRPIPEITTDITNINYNAEITDKVHTSDKSDGKAHTFPTGKDESKKCTRSELEEKQSEMIKRFDGICKATIYNSETRQAVQNGFSRYMSLYNIYTGKIHPILESITLVNVCDTLSAIADTQYNRFENSEIYKCDSNTGLTCLDKMINEHFKRDHKQQTNFSITHFANSEYLSALANSVIER